MIQIKNPCDANWQEMSPAESGKYCGACEKVVVDFSKMNDVQIKEYFNEYATQKTCGRFLASQIDRPLQATTPVASLNFWRQVNRFPVFKSMVLLWASSVMWLTSCFNKNTTDEMITGDSVSIPINPDTSATITQPNDLPPIQDPEGIKMGEVAPEKNIKCLPPTELMGDVMVLPSDKPDTVAVTIPATSPDTSDVTIHMIKGTVMMRDTISQKIIRKKK